MNKSHNRLSTDTLIVGAGLTGLAVAARLKADNLDYIVVDSQPSVGYTWAKRHPQLRLNTHKLYSSMHNTIYAAGTRSFPTRDEVIDHLKQFQADHDIDIIHNMTVMGVDAPVEGAIRVTTSGMAIDAKRIVFCTGLDGFSKPFHVPGVEAYKGMLIHSRDMGNTADYRGKSVVVVGGGNSGFDVLNHMTKAQTKALYFSVRGMSPVLPKRIYGFSTHLAAPLLSRMPLSWADRLIMLTQRMAFGDIKKLGFPRVAEQGVNRLRNGRAIAVDDGAMAAVKAGRVEVIDAIECLTHDGIKTVRGREIACDVVIHANGYLPGVSRIDGLNHFLSTQGLPNTDRYGRSLVDDRVWFAGHYPTMMSFFHTAQFQAEAIVAEQRV